MCAKNDEAEANVRSFLSNHLPSLCSSIASICIHFCKYNRPWHHRCHYRLPTPMVNKIDWPLNVKVEPPSSLIHPLWFSTAVRAGVWRVTQSHKHEDDDNDMQFREWRQGRGGSQGFRSKSKEADPKWWEKYTWQVIYPRDNRFNEIF